MRIETMPRPELRKKKAPDFHRLPMVYYSVERLTLECILTFRFDAKMSLVPNVRTKVHKYAFIIYVYLCIA